MAEGTRTTSFPSDLTIRTTEMHTGGEPLRIIESGYPEPRGTTILEKRNWLKTCADEYRKLLMFEPRGHYDMYGALMVSPDLPGADLGVIFMHNEGYSTMCGHAVIALGRYAVDRRLVQAVSPETRVVIQCPCGPVTAHVQYSQGRSGGVRFHSVPSYVFALDISVKVPGVGEVVVDISYGGAFYAFVPAQRLGLDLNTSSTSSVADVAQRVTEAVKSTVKLHHPDSPDLAFLYGTIVTDGGDHSLGDNGDAPTTNICVFADKQVDRSPTGSGVSARVALQYNRRVISLGQIRHFRSGVTGSQFTGSALREVKLKGAGFRGGDVVGVVAEVSGRAHYTGMNTFTVEADDALASGFLAK
ncbi:hypothetical protein BaRGS_00003769 [Batillaria attramentaria]|uniref:trans-L-3-hydroxyproline dehydratase n=1 Tax=Batillaria attramentaria TaxID=370345 RepID=A0ABD0LZR3_9CAEN